MKHENLEKICSRINAVAKLEKDKILVPTDDIALVCEDDDGAGHVVLNMFKWREPSLLTARGRERQKQNDAAIARIKAFAESLGSLEWDGTGDGAWGPFDCYRLLLAEVQS